MRRIFIRWAVIGIITLAISLVFLAVHMMSLQNNTNDEYAQTMQREIREYFDRDRSTVKANTGDKRPSEQTPLGSGMIKLKQDLTELAKEIHKAKTHIRGTKAREAVINAMNIMSDILKLTNTSIEETKRKKQHSKNICDEMYKGTTFGYPFFYKGFETQNCSYSTPINKLVTIIFIYKNRNISQLETILKGISKYNSAIQVFVGAYTKIKSPVMGNNSIVRVYPKSDSDGNILNSLVSYVRTEYILIARNITDFNIDVRLDRLIREIESLDVKVAGGAARDQDGHWKLGCYQSVYKNYSLVYYEGYDESLHECIFCDYIDAPFVINTETLNKYKFDVNMNGVSVFLDFFLRLSNEKIESVVCPDSMFYMQKYKKSKNATNWETLSRKWNLSRMKYSDEIDISFECKNYRCFNGLGFTVTPCCLQELADMVNFVMKICEENNIICELQEGSLLGAVKLQKVLPWERDADLTFLTANFSAFSKLQHHIKKKYSYSDDGNSLWCCVDNRTAGGKMKVNSKHWHVELYGQHIMDSEMLRAKGQKPTKILLNGNWVGVPRNPGWHARNRYGHEIFAHAQHWMAMGKGNGWIHYKTNTFTPCQSTGRHDCLDRFNADGNMHFGLPIP